MTSIASLASTLAWPLRRLLPITLVASMALASNDSPPSHVTSAEDRLHAGCVVSVLNRNVQVAQDGSWLLPNVPAGFGKVRARATCVKDGVTRFGESEPFEVISNGSTNVPPIALGAVTPIPQLLTLTSTVTTLTSPGATTQLTASARYGDGTNRNVTAAATGTTYVTSNPAIATVSADGLVQAVASGTALIQASHEGASGLLSVTVVLSADSDGDGIPDDVELREGLDPSNPVDALEDTDRDGLSNRDELMLGTGMRNADSDGDGILDGEEVTPGADGFMTNPLLADTDGDGVRDGLEITSGSDPTDSNSINLAGALSRIEITPRLMTLVVNTLVNEAYKQLRVTGHLRDGTTLDLTATRWGTSYSSSNLMVCNFGGVEGRVYAGNEGSCTITVQNSGFTATASGVVMLFSPRPLAQISIPGYANNVEVSQDHAYVAAGSAGLQVVEVANKQNPTLIGSRDTPGNANDVRVSGRYAYVADGAAGLQVIDIINPQAPVIVGTSETPGDASDVMVANGIAYVADGAQGLALVDVRSPTSPLLVGSLATGGTARGVDVSGTLALVATDSPAPALRVVNVSDFASPVLVGSVALAGNPKDVRASGSLAYVASFTGGVQVVDFSTPTSPRVVGNLPGSAPRGFVPRDVEVVDRFAIFAEQLFPNAVTFVDILTPSAPVLRGILDFSSLSDYAGTGIAVSGPYVYMTGEFFIVGPENGTNGNTRLFIGQYLPLEDLAGLPPQVSITHPASGATYYSGEQIRVAANVTDDVAVGAVSFSVNGQTVFTDTSAPYEYVFPAPESPGTVTLAVAATDLAGNEASSEMTVQVLEDPLTTVSGIVVDESGVPIEGATVSTVGDRTSLTSTSGTFAITGVPTRQSSLVVSARYTRPDGIVLSGSSAAVAPVRGGITNVGTIAAIPVSFETDYGSLVFRCDDCNIQRTLPFPFTYHGVTYSNVFVGSNGYLTFTAGDSAYSESVPRFLAFPRIAAFFDDLSGGGGVYVNDQLPGRFVVTYDRIPHYAAGGSNTLQIVLYADGRIQLGYRGITALTTGTIAGLSPGPNAPTQQVSYRDSRDFEVPAGNAVYEYFTSANPFDLDNGFILFTPLPAGGYRVRTILPTSTARVVQLQGTPSGMGVAAASATGESEGSSEQNIFAQAEVEVSSSSQPGYRGMTNTDSRGVFSLTGVPAGGIQVTLSKRGEVVGQGSAVLRQEGNSFQIQLQAPSTDTKQSPAP